MAAFSNRHKKRKLKAEINVVPYIDVMLVLLVIFMITASVMNLGVEVNLGQHASVGLELRYLHDRDHAARDPLSQGQVQALGGLNLYF